MRYNGGKKRIAKKVSNTLNKHRSTIYWEPFCGMASVALNINSPIRIVSDLDSAITTVLKAAIEGYEFPERLSEEEYKEAKKLPPTNPIHGFAKYGCSFAGKPWGGYARSGKRNYAMNARNSLKKYKGQNLIILTGDYTRIKLPYKPDLIYCDPPYANTTSVGINNKFDSTEFWNWAERREEIIYVSEYNAPPEWKEVFSEEITDGLVPKNRKKNVEKLFTKYEA